MAAVVMPPVPETRIDEDRAADILVGRGYHEAITYSFVDHAAAGAVRAREPRRCASRIRSPKISPRCG